MVEKFHIGDVIVPRYTGAFVIDQINTASNGFTLTYKLRELGTDNYVMLPGAHINNYRVALQAGAVPYVHRAE